MSRNEPRIKEVPELVVDRVNGRQYTRGKFLGKGGFGRCWELIDRATNRICAGKAVSKTMLTKKTAKDKLAQEIHIQKSLSHPNIVQFEGHFEDSDNVYILLELCARRSLMELHKRRRAVTEPEARYFIAQIADACEYLHRHKIIHRDLKLGNLFLNDDMVLKMGDFGLATVVEFEGERKKTLCGTPNYIAPEMLEKKGHSYEVDIWAVGCILYTLLVGRPPFETEALRETYNRIKNNQYVIPARVGRNAGALISRLLAPDPARRPSAGTIRQFAFFTEGYHPPRLPVSCLTTAPRFDRHMVSGGHADARYMSPRNNYAGRQMPAVPEQNAVERVRQDASSVIVLEKAPDQDDGPEDLYVADLHQQVQQVLGKVDGLILTDPEDCMEVEDPASTPIYWIAKWVDYSDKYGIGYALCDNSVGVLFNDSTKFMTDASGEHMQYTDRHGKEFYFVPTHYPEDLQKKVTLWQYFRSYMSEHLLKTGANYVAREGDELARLPFLSVWFRTKSAIVMHLSNGSLQINFFQDHTKLILCPLMKVVTFVDAKREFHTYKFEKMEELGIPKDLYPRFKYAKMMVERLASRYQGDGTMYNTNQYRSQSVGLGKSSASMTRGLPRPPSMQM